MQNYYLSLKDNYYLINNNSYLFLKDKNNNEIISAVKPIDGLIILLANGSMRVIEIALKISALLNINREKAINKVYETYRNHCIYLKLSDEYNFKASPISIKPFINLLKNGLTLDPYYNRSLDNLIIFLTNECSQNCIYCFLEKDLKKNKNKTLSIDELKSIAKDAYDLGVKNIELAGGEPLLRKDIIDIIEVFSSYNFNLALSTKKPFDEAFAIKLKKTNIQKFYISLDTIVPNIYEEIVGIPKDNLQKTLNSIKLLVKFDIKIIVKIVVMNNNIKDIPLLITILYNYGCYEFELIPYFTSSSNLHLNASNELYEILDESLITIEETLDNINIHKFYDLSSNKYSTKNSCSYCSARYNGIVIHADGKYGFCANTLKEDLKFSSIQEKNLFDIWNSVELHSFIFPNKEKYKGSDCYKCIDFYKCMPKRCFIRSLNTHNSIYNKDIFCECNNSIYEGEF